MLIVLVQTLLVSNIFAFDDKVTHPHLTRISAEKSNLGTYFRSQINLQDGIQTLLNGKSIVRWLQYGAEMEDDPACRASNHFHDPYKSWSEAGLTDNLWVVDLICIFQESGQYPPDEIYSNLTWATGHLNRSGELLSANALEANQWDWFDARKYFYTYLTGLDRQFQGSPVAPDQASRDGYLANTLRSLGQTMHLLQDAAVPAHVRNG